MATKLAPITGQMTLAKARILEAKILSQVDKTEGEVAELRRMMVEFDDGKGWRALNYGHYAAWARKRLPQYSKQHHFRLLDAATTERDCLGEEFGEHDPVPERVLREFSQVPEPKRREAWLKAREQSPKDPKTGEQVVTTGVAKKVAQLYPAASVGAPTDTKDQRGAEVAEDALKKVFDAAAGFDTVLSLLGRIKTNMDQLIQGPAGALLTAEINQIEEKRHWIYEAVRFARPFAVCIYCGGHHLTKLKCKACKGAGYLNEDRYKQAPKAPK